MLSFLLLQAAAIPPMPDLPTCTFDRPATVVARKAELPPEAVAELDRLFKFNRGIVEAGLYFEASDSVLVPNAPRARFLRAYGVGEIWFIWYEVGGIGLQRNVIALMPLRGDDGQIALRAAPGSNFSGDLCAASKGYLSGARSAG